MGLEDASPRGEIKMKVIKKETQEVEVLKDILCDICGSSTSTYCDFEYALLKASWGYGSMMDGEEHEAYICEKCYSTHIVPFIKSLGGKINITNNLIFP